MTLVLKEFRFATVSELFRYKQQGFELPEFPGYSVDQWGIKAHNRPWIEEAGSFDGGLKVIEVGGAYSTLPLYLARKYQLEAWVGDDFGESSEESGSWARWGKPSDLPALRPDVKYVFRPFGEFSSEYPDRYFDRVFSVSTLEHIPWSQMSRVWKDMHRVLATKGQELHSIDVLPRGYKGTIVDSILERLSLRLGTTAFRRRVPSPTWAWLKALGESGVDVSGVNSGNYPYSSQLLTEDVLFESYDVVYRFYPPNNCPKQYGPTASLLVVIQDV